VDRHIRLLDQSVKEQEAAISLGVHPGTHLAPILLPELIVPGSRAARAAAHSPAPALQEEDGGMTLGIVGEDEDEVHPQRRGKTRRGRLRKEDTVVVTEVGQTGIRNLSRNRKTRSLKLSGACTAGVKAA